MKERPLSVSVRSMRMSEKAAFDSGVSSRELMKKAGEGIYRACVWETPVAVVCGKGNNAGDGYVAASLMSEDGIDCTLILLSDSFSEDGRYYFEACREKGIPYKLWSGPEDLTGFSSVLDCIFGTGFRGEAEGTEREAIEAINRSGAFVVSADINSGLNGDTGEGSVYVLSDLTVSVGCFKDGHFRGDAPDAMKKLVNVDLGIEIKDYT